LIFSKIYDYFFGKKSESIKSKKIQKLKSKKNINIKPYFVDMRVHNDYRDTITAFNNVAPDQRPIFNRSVLPVKQIDANPQQVKPLVKSFIKRVNDEIRYNITDNQEENSGWDELAPEKKEDGWNDYMNNLSIRYYFLQIF
jgi:hypothetical protein